MHLLHRPPREDAAAPLEYSDDDLQSVLSLDEPADEREAVAFEFVHQASLDPAGVTDEMRPRLAEHFTPAR